MLHQDPGQLIRGAGIAAARQNVLLDRLLPAFLDCRHAVLVEIAQQLLAIHRRRLQRRNRRHEMVPHRVAKRKQRFVRAPHHQAANRGLLVGHRKRSVVERPTRAVARIEGVVLFAREVIEAVFVEPLRIILAEQRQARPLIRRQVRIVRVGFRCEEIRRVRTHLVKIHVHHRQPLAQRLHLAEDLRLGQPDPIAIQVEQVMIGAAAGPRLIVLGRARTRIRHQAASLLEVVHEAVAPVRVLRRIDQHHHLRQHIVHNLVVARGQQVVRGHQRRVRGRDLVAVDSVGEPDHGRQTGDQLARLRLRRLARVGDALDPALDLAQLADIGLGADRGVDQLSALPALPVLEYLDAVRHSGGQRIHVLDQSGVVGDLVARLVTEHLAHRRNLRVVTSRPARIRMPFARTRARETEPPTMKSQTFS